ncbi:MAG: SLBB domain-containing protein, partial [Acidobacteriales bacterium]|nr:SLBB domain-containing protein [Terriglobales bacterium]
ASSGAAAGNSALLSARLGDQASLGGGPQADALSTAAGLNAPLSQPPVNPSSPRSGGARSTSSSDFRAGAPMASMSVPQNPAGVRAPSSLSSQPFLSRQPNPYADVPSLYDLYAQYSKRAPYLQRFGLDVFRNGSGNFEQLPMDLPAGPDYVLGSGDGLSIDLWGGISERLRRVVDREGKISLPEVGNVQVAGRTLGDVQQMVQSAMRTQLRNIQVDVSLTRLRTIRVYVVGDVQNPGAYDVSSLSTPLNALLAAGGPTDGGSLRLIKHSREQKVIENVDIYDLLLHGVHASTQRLESGDTILVPPLGPVITVQGMVRRPAIYELNGEKDLAQVLELAGGVLSTGNLSHIDVERLVAHQSRTMIAVDLPQDGKTTSAANLESIPIQDGDRINISPIISFADKTVYLDGHVSRPGKYAYTDGMKVSDLIKSYKDLLPEPYEAHAEVIRLKAPDYTPQVIAFNLGDAMKGGDQDMALQPLDTVRVFGRFDFQDAPVVTVTGAVREPGDHVTNGATYLRDAIFLAGNTTGDAQMDDVQIFRMQGGQLRVLSANLTQALAGDEKENILLEPKDRVFVHNSLTHSDPPQVTVEGEVQRPGTYPLGSGMTAAELVRVAGGLQRSAYTAEADLTQYMVEHGQKIVADHQEVPIARALSGDPDTDVRLHDGDVLTIRQLSGWKDRGATIAVSGEVAHPGSYGIQPGEHLSSVLARAGGLLPGAYPYGTILQRMQVRELEELNHSQLVRQVQQEGVGLKAVDDPISKESAVLQWKSTLEKLQNTPPTGRLIIHMSSNVRSWANTPADIEVRAGDTLYIPRKPNFVMVDGAVYNPTAVTFKPGKNVGWYLRQAGGPSNVANKRATFVVRADGSVIGGGSAGLFSGGVEDAQLQAGDTVVVPDKAYGGGLTWRNTLQAAQIVSAAGIAIQVARGF